MSKLSKYLTDSGLSGRDFAATIGVDASIVSRLRHSLMQPSLKLAVAIERATGGAVPAISWEPETQPDPPTEGATDILAPPLDETSGVDEAA